MRQPREVDTTTLAERLGYGPGERLLIVNCDDLGSSHAANVAIERALNDGIATSATLMVPCPWAREAVRRLAGADIGVHLTFTAEYPGYRWRSLTRAVSLHDSDGFLPATAAEAIAKATPDDIRAEGRAQIEQALAWGVDITHLDSHMGVVQIDARLFEVYLDLAAEFALPLRMFGARTDQFLGFNGKERATRRGAIFADHILDSWGGSMRELLSDKLPHLAEGVTEVFGHPVDDGPELRGYDPDNAQGRVDDGVCFSDPAVKEMINSAGVTPISYRPLRDMQRAK
ncbi:MAG TPA: ChbG/HpnK family deacetylase [Caulobacteraceae bacterium]